MYHDNAGFPDNANSENISTWTPHHRAADPRSHSEGDDDFNPADDDVDPDFCCQFKVLSVFSSRYF